MNLTKIKEFVKNRNSDEEIQQSVSLYEQGKNEENISKRNRLYLESFQKYNRNLDGLFELVKYHRLKGEFKKGFDLGMRYILKFGYSIEVFPKTNNVDIYKYRFLDELYLCAYYIGEYGKACDIISSLISSEHNDEKGVESELSRDFNRMGKNLQYVLDKLNTQKIPDKIEKTRNIRNNKHSTIGVGVPCIPRDFDVLSKLLDSISRQTLQPLEVVVSLSNASETDSQKFKEILLKYSDIRFKTFITGNSHNASQNRNVILEYFHDQHEFEILSFIDSDDEMHSQRLEIVSKSFVKYSCDLLLHGYFTDSEPDLPEWFRIRNNDEVKYLLQRNKNIISWSDGRLHYGHVSMSKQVKIKQNTKMKIGEDYQFVYDTYLQNKKIYHLQIPLSKYIKNTQNTQNSMSFCFTLYNRMKMNIDDRNILTLFPKCLKSLLNIKKDSEEWEICVSDFGSTDVNVQNELAKIISSYDNVTFKFIEIQDKFSRGLGLNKAFELSTKETIFFVDVDMLFLDRTVIDNTIKYVKSGKVYFPMCSSFKNIYHTEYFCQKYGYGNMAISRNNFTKHKWMIKYTWGNEDDDMHHYWKNNTERDYVESFCHQWHPTPTDVPEHRRMIGDKVDNNLKNFLYISPNGTFVQKVKFINNYYSLAKRDFKKLIVNENKEFQKQFYKLFNTVPDLQFQKMEHQPEYSGINITQNHLDWGLFEVNTRQIEKLQKYSSKMKKGKYIALSIFQMSKYLEIDYTPFDGMIEKNKDKSIFLYTNDENILQRFREKYLNVYTNTSKNRDIENMILCIMSDQFLGTELCNTSELITNIRNKHQNITRIQFKDFWPIFNDTLNFFTENLTKYGYNYEVVNSNPDIIIFSVFGNYHRKLQKGIIDEKIHKVFYTGENVPPIPNANINLTFHNDSQHNNIRLPLWILHGGNKIKNKKLSPKETSNFCCFVYSNQIYYRNLFCQKLSQYKKVDCGGDCLNNIGEKVIDKINFQSKYKFCIAYENSSSPGYTTEKILDAYSSNCIPIYYGSDTITDDFNSETFINAHDFDSDEDLINYIKKVDTNKDLYDSFMNKPIFSKKWLTRFKDSNETYFRNIMKNIFSI